MSEHQSYIRIMSDIIDSGIWAKLSSAARTLYPVLLKFSDFYFKPVWPSTETLLGLTGFKTKKSLNEAKRDLIKLGLLHVIPGSGRTSTYYYFRFDYPGSQIKPLGDKNIPLWGGEFQPSEGAKSRNQGGIEGYPNNINITINNNQNNETKKEIEEQRKFEKPLKSKQNSNVGFDERVSWKSFLDWVDSKLSVYSAREFHSLKVELDGRVLCVLSPVTDLQKNIIESYFDREETDISLVFALPKVENRIF
ncbi:MAG: helix-turn-helix domain-containing protein [Leptospira sp.]|nr:helix-turn-helix domain-containing protein [Leptospira sp.]